jgi:hypothetical protein
MTKRTNCLQRLAAYCLVISAIAFPAGLSASGQTPVIPVGLDSYLMEEDCAGERIAHRKPARQLSET